MVVYGVECWCGRVKEIVLSGLFKGSSQGYGKGMCGRSSEVEMQNMCVLECM